MKKNLIGSIVSAVIGAVALCLGIANGAEMSDIKNSHAALVKVGSKTISRAEYLEQAEVSTVWCVTIGILFVALAVALYLRHKKQNKAG